MSAPNPNTAQAVIGALNKVIKYAIGLGAGASALQTSLYTGVEEEEDAAVAADNDHKVLLHLAHHAPQSLGCSNTKTQSRLSL